MTDTPEDLPPCEIPPEEIQRLDEWMTEQTKLPGHGGKRVGAGRPRKQSQRGHVERYNEARATKEAHLATLRGLEAKQRSGELAPIDTLRDAMADVIRQIVAALDAVPGKLKREAPHLTAEDLRLVEREITRARNLAAKARCAP